MKSCRDCEYFVPRAGMCVESRSTLKREMPLRRSADDVCTHHVEWKPNGEGDIARLQFGDRMAAFPEAVGHVGGIP